MLTNGLCLSLYHYYLKYLLFGAGDHICGQITKKEVKPMKNDSSMIINVYGDNNTIKVCNEKKCASRTSKKSWLQALGKLIHSAIVNISVLLIEIFTKLG